MPFIVETFEVIKGTHTELDEFEEIYIKGWDAKSKVEATQFLNSLTKFEFVIGMIECCNNEHTSTRKSGL